MRTTLVLVWSLAVSLPALSQGREPVPSDVKKVGEAMEDGLKKMVADDPNLMKDLGAQKAEDLKGLKLDYAKSFSMQKVDTAKIEGAKSLKEAIVPTGIYYVPFCDGARCPMTASFNTNGGHAEFESVGQPNLTRQILETGSVLAGDAGLARDSLRVVQFPEASVGFFLAEKTGGGEVLIPQSEAEGKALLAALDRAPTEVDAQGRPRFSLSDLKVIAKNVRERNETSDGVPTTGVSDLEEFDPNKPSNAPRGAKVDSRSAMIDLGSTGAPQGAPVPRASAASAAPVSPVATAVAAENERTQGRLDDTKREEANRGSWLVVSLFSALLVGWLVRRRFA